MSGWAPPSDVWPGLPEKNHEPPYAEIEQTGRFTFLIRIHDGVFTWGPDGGAFWFVGRREWAEWRASRLLLTYVRREERHERAEQSRTRIGG